MTNKEEIFDLLQKHPDGLDDDDITRLTGISSRQQVQQLCNQLATSNRIRRQSVEKVGKRKKIHNFPLEMEAATLQPSSESDSEFSWRKRLSALVAATGHPEEVLLDMALRLLAMKVLREDHPGLPLAPEADLSNT